MSASVQDDKNNPDPFLPPNIRPPDVTKDEAGNEQIVFWGVRFNNTDVRGKDMQTYLLVIGGFSLSTYFLVSLVDPSFYSMWPLMLLIALPAMFFAIVKIMVNPTNPNQNLGDGFEYSQATETAQISALTGRLVVNERGLDGMITKPWGNILDVFMQGALIVLSKKKEWDAILLGNKMYLNFKNEAEAQLFYDFAWEYTHKDTPAA